MTVLSVGLGMTLPQLIPKHWTQFFSCVLFVVFGVKLLVDVYVDEEGGVLDEMQEVEEELSEHANKGKDLTEGADGPGETDDDLDLESQRLSPDRRAAPAAAPRPRQWIHRFFTPVAVQCFTMTFLAEWGDRSQVSTIALAAAKDPIGVCVGSTIAHCVCTALAVVGGKLLAFRISERVVNGVGGLLFLVFAVTGFMSAQAQ
jgi:putative Ca2+/H+ antiporter (TMEM165/GDT1 family)